MSSSISDTERIRCLNTIISQINFYVGILIFFFGIMGNILNILILSQQHLRSNTCIMIFLASSTAGIITIVSGLTSRILSNWNADLSNTIRWICKIRAFILFTFRSITFWLIMLATIDRWIVSSTSGRLRRISSNKNVLRSILFITCLSIIIHCNLLYCYESNLDNTPLKCFNKHKICRLLNDLTFIFITILIPLILIAIFGWMTILNIRLSQIRTESVSFISHSLQIVGHDQRRRRFKKMDNYLFIMLFIHVILLAFLTLPVAIEKLYATLTMNNNKSVLQTTIEDFIYQITLLMTFIATGMQFYINTLTGGKIFRKPIIDFYQLIIRKIKCQ